MRITENFSLSEFDSKDGAIMPDHVKDNIIILAENLQRLRNYFDVPITINSGYRSPSHNATLGGAKRSQHLLGTAADIVVKGVSPAKVTEAIEELIKNGEMLQGGLKAYNSFTHYDIRGTKARW
jgi:uncharacterized protein YcbK (DUF882 family)